MISGCIAFGFAEAVQREQVMPKLKYFFLSLIILAWLMRLMLIGMLRLRKCNDCSVKKLKQW